MRFMQDNRHYRAEKQDGFWDFVTRDPGDYQGRHRLDSTVAHQVWVGCQVCLMEMSS